MLLSGEKNNIYNIYYYNNKTKFYIAYKSTSQNFPNILSEYVLHAHIKNVITWSDSRGGKWGNSE